MTRLAFAAVVLALAGLSAVAAARTTAVGVGLREYRVSSYRASVRTGTVRFNVRNLGEDTHDLAVLRGGKVVKQGGLLRPGDTRTLSVRLTRPGVYVLECTLADHAALGMRTKLRVRR